QSQGQMPVRLVRKPPPQQLGDHQPEHAVPEKFEPFVTAAGRGGAGAAPSALASRRGEGAGMGQRIAEKLGARKMMADQLCEIVAGQPTPRRESALTQRLETAGYSGSRTAISRTPTNAHKGRRRELSRKRGIPLGRRGSGPGHSRPPKARGCPGS